MTRPENDNVFGEVIEVILQNGLEGLADALSLMINEAMKVERSRALQANPYERNDARKGVALSKNPHFKPKKQQRMAIILSFKALIF